MDLGVDKLTAEQIQPTVLPYVPSPSPPPSWSHSGYFAIRFVARLGLSTPEGGDDGAQQRAADGIRHYRGRVALSGG